MKLCNDCDLNYRASKNKRLLVELALIQVAQLTAEGDDLSGGRSPKKTLNPVFTQPAVAQQPQVNTTSPAHQSVVHPTSSMVGTKAPNSAATTRQSQVAATTVAKSATPSAGISNVASQGVGISPIVREEKKIPVMKMSSLGVSIKHPQREQITQSL